MPYMWEERRAAPRSEQNKELLWVSMLSNFQRYAPVTNHTNIKHNLIANQQR